MNILLTCREGYEAALQEELLLRLEATDATPAPQDIRTAPGLVEVHGQVAREVQKTGRDNLIFARQWLLAPVWIPAAQFADGVSPALDAVLGNVARSTTLWTVHAFAPTEEGESSLTREAAALAERVVDAARLRVPEAARRYVLPSDAGQGPLLVLQLCLTPAGLWHALMKADELLDRHAGGIHRMHFDPRAPSRSYLKIEEAFDLMGEEPRSGQRVVDLGASPGGWSHAFLKRGCAVVAVDRGPLRLAESGRTGGKIMHLREDGISYAPPRQWLPVDWLVSDMLVPPGKTLGMLRRWLEGRWMRRFVVNVKIPQLHPYPVIQPIEDLLAGTRRIVFRMRQLYHDRREVTIWGRLRDR